MLWVGGFLVTLAKLFIMTIIFFIISIFVVILTLMGLATGNGRRVLLIAILAVTTIILSLVFVTMLIDFYYNAIDVTVLRPRYWGVPIPQHT